MEGIENQSLMTLPLYQDSPVPKLKQTWITSILLNTQFMFLKIIFSLENLTTSGYIDPYLEYICHIYLSMLPTYPFYSTQNLEMFPLNVTASMIMNSKLAKGMQSLNHFGNINTNVRKKLLNDMNLTIYQQNHLIPEIMRLYLMI